MRWAGPEEAGPDEEFRVLSLHFSLSFFRPHQAACGILAGPPGMEPRPPVVEPQSPNQ